MCLHPSYFHILLCVVNYHGCISVMLPLMCAYKTVFAFESCNDIFNKQRVLWVYNTAQEIKYVFINPVIISLHELDYPNHVVRFLRRRDEWCFFLCYIFIILNAPGSVSFDGLKTYTSGCQNCYQTVNYKFHAQL